MSHRSTLSRSEAGPIHLYLNKDPYRVAAGRASKRDPIEDRLADAMAMVALDKDQPSSAQFLWLARREMKNRNYKRKTIRSYLAAIRSILRWFGRQPHLLTRHHVKNYLAYLYDGEHSASDMAVQLTAIRNVWDKFCFRDVTLGMATPRPKRQRVVVISRQEVLRLLQAAPSLRDKLLIGLMYGTGMRVSEVCRLRWRDIDHDRNQIFIWQGKGSADRHVQLPEQYKAILERLGRGKLGDGFLFPSEASSNRKSGRYLSTRTVQRVVRGASRIAGIQKKVTPHSLRHAFATHSFESGCDVRRIQKVLGHVRLETTTIYVKVAKEQTHFPSPLDQLAQTANASPGSAPTESIAGNPTRTEPSASKVEAALQAGHLRVHTRPDPRISEAEQAESQRTQITIELRQQGERNFLLGTLAEMPRTGFITINLPPQEDWEAEIRAMPSSSRDLVNDESFYPALQSEITRRMLQVAATNDDAKNGSEITPVASP